MAEKHAGQHQAVLDLGNLHIGLVNLDIYFQAIGLGGHTLLNHLVNVVAQLLNQVAVAVGELLLLAQGHYHPVGLVYVV